MEYLKEICPCDVGFEVVPCEYVDCEECWKNALNNQFSAMFKVVNLQETLQLRYNLIKMIESATVNRLVEINDNK